MVNDLTSWFSDIRDVLNDSSSPLTLRNGLWQVNDKESLWKELGPRIFDEDLDTLSEVAVKVFVRTRPQVLTYLRPKGTPRWHTERSPNIHTK